jgi:hypothetical protein
MVSEGESALIATSIDGSDGWFSAVARYPRQNPSGLMHLRQVRDGFLADAWNAWATG